ncbi:MAG: hypothetical protein NVSMB5_24500 [Candidatus Velthaea sp.]
MQVGSSLPQQALDIAVNLQAAIANGAINSDREIHLGILVGLQLLAQNALAAVPSSNTINSGLIAVDVAPTSPISEQAP